MSQEKGFSVVEVLVTIFVLAILASGVWVWWEQKIQKPSPTKISPEQTTLPAASEISPVAASPQNKIAFIRDKDIWLINPDGTGEERVVTLSQLFGQTEGLSIKKMSWSPDGTLLAFQIDTSLGNVNELRIFRLADKTVSLIFQTGAVGPIYDFAWAPSSKEIVVSYPSNEKELLNLYRSSDFLTIVSVENSSEQADPFLGWAVPITKIEVSSGWVYFLDQNKKLWKALYSGPRYYPIAKDEEVSDFDLSADGSKIVYVEDKKDNLWVFDLASGNQHTLTTDGTGETTDVFISYTGYFNPLWPPDGTKIAFKKGVGVDGIEIGYMDADGTNQKLLQVEDFLASKNSIRMGFFLLGKMAYAAIAPPTIELNGWSPDSQSLMITYHHNDLKLNKDLHIFDLKNNKPKKLAVNASQPAWQPR